MRLSLVFNSLFHLLFISLECFIPSILHLSVLPPANNLLIQASLTILLSATPCLPLPSTRECALSSLRRFKSPLFTAFISFPSFFFSASDHSAEVKTRVLRNERLGFALSSRCANMCAHNRTAKHGRERRFNSLPPSTCHHEPDSQPFHGGVLCNLHETISPALRFLYARVSHTRAPQTQRRETSMALSSHSLTSPIQFDFAFSNGDVKERTGPRL